VSLSESESDEILSFSIARLPSYYIIWTGMKQISAYQNGNKLHHTTLACSSSKVKGLSMHCYFQGVEVTPPV